MKPPRIFPDAWYGDALPSGEFVVLVPGQPLQTHAGLVALPEEDTAFGPQFLKISPTKDRFAGKAHDSNKIFEYLFLPKQWWAKPQISGRFVYDPHGNILDTLPAGYGYFDTDLNIPISRIKTYEEFKGLNNWTKIGALYIGQGHDGGVLVWTGVNLRVLDTGPCNEVNAHAEGEAVAVTYRKDGVGILVWQTTFFELLNLPVYQPLVVPPVVPPTPELPVLQAPNVFAIVQAVKDRLQINLKDEANHGIFLDYCCAELGGHPWGRKLKNDGVTTNTDVLAYERTDKWIEYYDVIIGDGSGNIGWGPTGPFKPGENGTWIQSINPNEGEQPPAPQPAFTLIDTSRLEAILAALINQGVALEARLSVVEARPQTPAVSFPKRIALKDSRGKYLRSEWSDNTGRFDRDAVGGGEVYDVEPQE